MKTLRLSYSQITNLATKIVEIIGIVMAIGAMTVIAVRAALRLETRWDTFAYHLPFASMRAGLKILYELPPYLQSCYNGFPPLPEFIQGLLWRLTGSINATGTVNYLALTLFFYFAWRHLGSRLWILVLLSLTAPLVLIHATSSYVDLFSNALLSIGVTSLFAMILFDRWLDKRLLAWALGGITAAAWSKYTMLPIVLAVFGCFLVVYVWHLPNQNARWSLRWALIALLVASLPYLKNIIIYHNPTWPLVLPVFAHHMPTMINVNATNNLQLPPPLKDSSQFSLFFHSLFEIGHPTSYPYRERWIIDQGNAWIAYRSGGFWVIGVITATLSAILLGFLSTYRRGLTIMVLITALWCFIAIIPHSHELRYFLFLPLSMAALIAMLIQTVQKKFPKITLAIMLIIIGEFIWVSNINHKYYRIEKVGYEQAAKAWNIYPYWSTLTSGKTYCAVDFEPAAFLLTGPTMREFHIIERPAIILCPTNTTILTR